MRHMIQSAALLLLILALAGCGAGGNGVKKTNKGNSVEEAMEDQMKADDAGEDDPEKRGTDTDASAENADETDSAAQEQESETVRPEGSNQADGTGSVDYDLTEMNSDMVYATVYQMMTDPASYVGKIVKIRGPFYPYTNSEETVYFPACVIEDALACCSQGIEFSVPGAEYPDGYPEMGTVITVTGTFETYTEAGPTSCRLANATLDY